MPPIIPENSPAAPWIEAAGTAALTSAVFGSGIMADRLTASPGLTLLVASGVTAAMLYVLITVLAPLSGAHLNPAITLALVMNRTIRPARAAVFAVAQLCGAVSGTLLTHALFDLPLFQLGRVVRAGPSLWLSEGLATFGLIVVAALGSRTRPQAVPALVGGYVFAAYWFTSSTGFSNPAVTVARALTASVGGMLPVNAPAYMAAQVAGAALAAILLKRLPQAGVALS